MAEYVLDHHLEGEGARLALMSRLLDPMHRRHIESLGVAPGSRAVEVGCGNGSISAWLAERVGPSGEAVAFDLDLSLVDVRAPRLELRQGDIVAGPARSPEACALRIEARQGVDEAPQRWRERPGRDAHVEEVEASGVRCRVLQRLRQLPSRAHKVPDAPERSGQSREIPRAQSVVLRIRPERRQHSPAAVVEHDHGMLFAE